MPDPRVCSICSTEKGALVNALLQGGRSPHYIEGQMRSMDSPVKAETIRRHVKRCLNGKIENIGLLEQASRGEKVTNNTDFAIAIRAEANRRLAEGTLTVTAQHGLQAQALIDRRAEKAADRRMMVELAGLLSGAISLDGPPEDLIEGEFTEVSDDADQQALAPLALVMNE
jgi:hypothetical protein